MMSRSQNKLIAAFSLSLASFLGAHYGNFAGEDSTAAKASEQANSSGLSAPIELRISGTKIQIAPPLNYKITEKMQGTTHMYTWQGAARANGSCPSFMVAAMAAPQGAEMPTLEQAINAILEGIKTQRTGWQQNEFESFKLNGRSFGRIYWDSLDKVKNVPIRGYQYATISGRRIFLFASQDLLPFDKETLPLCEHSIESFKILSE